MTRFPALLTAGMHRTEQRNRKHRAFRLFAPRQPIYSASGSMRPSSPQLLFRSGSDARADLSLACNESRSHGFHSRVKAPGLPLRFPPAASTTRSASCSATDSRFAPGPAVSLLKARCRFPRPALPAAPWLPLPFRTLYVLPDQSVLPLCCKLTRLPNPPDSRLLPAALIYC